MSTHEEGRHSLRSSCGDMFEATGARCPDAALSGTSAWRSVGACIAWERIWHSAKKTPIVMCLPTQQHSAGRVIE